MLPVLYEDESSVHRWRATYAAGLRDLHRWFSRIDASTAPRALAALSHRVNFYIGYQGQNDLDLQRDYAGLVNRAARLCFPQWSDQLPHIELGHGERIRIGYISAHLRSHSVAKLFIGWLEEHDRDRFEIFAYHNGEKVDDMTHRVRSSVEHFRHCPGQLEPLCRSVRADDLHVAVYLDVRHRRMSVMSSLQLAPIQCVTWAYPQTSGNTAIDYFLSSDSMEPPDGDQHYSEKLIRLPGIGVFYHKPLVPRHLLTRQRSDFGLDPLRNLYLCCQSLFKYLPQHDDVFVEIARRDAKAQFAFLSMNDAVDRDLMTRLGSAFRKAGLSVTDHVTVVPQLSWLDYMNLNLLSDVFLDSLEWSGGVTALEALACELPIVTLPGEFMRGRHSYGILRQAGLLDCIARDKNHLVELAVRLGTDKTYNREARQRIRSQAGRLFADKTPVRALEAFYTSAVRSRAQ